MGSGVSHPVLYPPNLNASSLEYSKKLISLQAITKDPKYALHIQSILDNEAVSFSKITTFILKLAKTDNEKAYMAYLFMKTKLSFDSYLYSQIPIQPEVRILENILKERKSLSWGLASLYQKICQSLGVQCQVISGFSKLYYMTHKNLKEKYHWWNVINMENDWFIVDIASASYYSGDDYWYLMSPQLSIYSQFSMKKYNFLKENIGLNEFIDLPCLGPKYFEYGFKLEKDSFRYIYKLNGAFSAKFNFDFEKYNVITTLSSQLTLEANDLINRTYLEKLSANLVELKTIFPQKGIYEVKVEASPIDLTTYFLMFSFLIEYEGENNKYNSFPYSSNLTFIFSEP